MNQKIRLFIAIDLPEAVKDVLTETAVCLAKNVPDRAVRWVNRAQMHLTLRFLGDTAVAQLPALQDQLTQLTAHYPAFQLRLDGLGAFPNRSGRGWCGPGWRVNWPFCSRCRPSWKSGWWAGVAKGGTAV